MCMILCALGFVLRSIAFLSFSISLSMRAVSARYECVCVCANVCQMRMQMRTSHICTYEEIHEHSQSSSWHAILVTQIYTADRNHLNAISNHFSTEVRQSKSTAANTT